MNEPSPTRCILHADMDSFYAAVEQRDRPELQGKPVIVGGSGPRGVVSTASYEARKFGVHSAMPGAEARRRCPHGIFVPARMEAYVDVSAQVFEVFRGLTPEVEGLSLDEAFLDVTASRALFGEGPEIAARLRAEVLAATGLTVSVGVATSKFLAKVASDLDKPDGLVVVKPGTELEFLAPLPISRLFGAGAVTQQRLQQAGFATIRDVQTGSEDALVGAVGARAAQHFRALALAQDQRPVLADREAKSVSHECTFPEDITDIAHCRDVLLDQAERVGRRLRKHGMQGRVVRLKLRFPPFETLVRQQTLATPTDEDLEIFEVAARLFARAHGDRPVRLLGLGVAGFDGADPTADVEPKPVQGTLFGSDPSPNAPAPGSIVAPGGATGLRGAADPQGGAPPDRDVRERVSRAMDAIRDRFGEGSIRRGRGGVGGVDS